VPYSGVWWPQATNYGRRLYASPQSNDASASASCSTDPANLAGSSPLSRITTVDHRPRRALPPRYHGRRLEQAEALGGRQAKQRNRRKRGWRWSNGRTRVCVTSTLAGRLVNAGGAVTFRRQRRLQEGEANGLGNPNRHLPPFIREPPVVG
jgi:hypothetical protein